LFPEIYRIVSQKQLPDTSTSGDGPSGKTITIARSRCYLTFFRRHWRSGQNKREIEPNLIFAYKVS